MTTKKQIYATASLLASFFLWAGFSTPAFANPNDKQLQEVTDDNNFEWTFNNWFELCYRRESDDTWNFHGF